MLLPFAASCGRAAHPAAHTSELPRSPAPRGAAAAPAARTWLTDALAWPAVNAAPVRSLHFGPTTIADIRVNPEARSRYLGLVADTTFDSGTRIVESIVDERTGTRGPLLTMKRDESGWNFGIAEADGTAERAAPGFCAECHAGAIAPPVFGLPPTEARRR